MRHFHSNFVESYVLRHKPSLPMAIEVMAAFGKALDASRGFVPELAANFVFFGDRPSASFLAESLTPAEFRSIVEMRKWYKEIDKQFQYYSPKVWCRLPDFVYCNLNSGKCFVCVDAHYWD